MRVPPRPILAALWCVTSAPQALANPPAPTAHPLTATGTRSERIGPDARYLAQTVDAKPAADAVQAAADLQGDDRDRFVQATRLFRSGAVSTAYQTAKPPFEASPKNPTWQDMTCRLPA